MAHQNLSLGKHWKLFPATLRGKLLPSFRRKSNQGKSINVSVMSETPLWVSSKFEGLLT